MPSIRRVAGLRRLPIVALWVTVVVLVGAGGGSAYAYITATGSGTGRATVGTLHAVAVASPSGGPATTLFPGQSANLRLTLDDSNPFPVTITGVAPDGPVAVTGGTDCTAADAGVTVSIPGTLTIPLMPGRNSVTVPTGVSMSESSATGCQGASFNIPVAVTARS